MRTFWKAVMLIAILVLAMPVFAGTKMVQNEKNVVTSSIGISTAKTLSLKISGIERLNIGFPEEFKKANPIPTISVNALNKTLTINGTKYSIILDGKIELAKINIWLYENISNQISIPLTISNGKVSDDGQGFIEFLNEKSEPFAYIEQPFWQYNETTRNTKEYIRFSYNGTHLILSAEPKGFCFNRFPCYIDPSFQIASNKRLRIWSIGLLNSTGQTQLNVTSGLMMFNLTSQPNQTLPKYTGADANILASNFTYIAFWMNVTNFRPAIWNTTFCDNLTKTFRKGRNTITTTGATNFSNADWVYVFDQPYGWNLQYGATRNNGTFNKTLYQRFSVKSFDPINNVTTVYENADSTFFLSNNPVMCNMDLTKITINGTALNMTDYTNPKPMTAFIDTIYWSWGDFLVKSNYKFSWVNTSGIVFQGLNGSFIGVEGVDKFTLYLDDLNSSIYNYTSCSYANNSCDIAFAD